jgi:DNA-binding XRE family transcriptional regulator
MDMNEFDKRWQNAVRIRELREKAEMSQEDFARICFNVDVDKLKFWEDNDYSLLDLTLDEFCYFGEFSKRWDEILKMKMF